MTSSQPFIVQNPNNCVQNKAILLSIEFQFKIFRIQTFTGDYCQANYCITSKSSQLTFLHSKIVDIVSPLMQYLDESIPLAHQTLRQGYLQKNPDVNQGNGLFSDILQPSATKHFRRHFTPFLKFGDLLLPKNVFTDSQAFLIAYSGRQTFPAHMFLAGAILIIYSACQLHNCPRGITSSNIS